MDETRSASQIQEGVGHYQHSARSGRHGRDDGHKPLQHVCLQWTKVRCAIHGIMARSEEPIPRDRVSGDRLHICSNRGVIPGGGDLGGSSAAGGSVSGAQMEAIAVYYIYHGKVEERILLDEAG